MSVKIIVCVKTNMDLQMVRIKNREPVLEAIPYKVGDLEKNALEAAIQIRESAADVTVVALTVAEANGKIRETMKEALAIGADEAVIVADPALAATDQAAVAAAIARAVEKVGGADLLLFGEGSTDNYSGQVGSRVAELLGLPQIGYARKVEVAGTGVRAERSMDDMVETLEAPFPAVVTVVSEINEPRIPSLMNIMKAGKKPVTEFDARRPGAGRSRSGAAEGRPLQPRGGAGPQAHHARGRRRRTGGRPSSTRSSKKGSWGDSDGGDPRLQRQAGGRPRAGLQGQGVRGGARPRALRRGAGSGRRRRGRSELAAFGADTVYVSEDAALEGCIRTWSPTRLAQIAAPGRRHPRAHRLHAARQGAAPAAWRRSSAPARSPTSTAMAVKDGELVGGRYALGGNTVAEERIRTAVKVFAVMPKTFEVGEPQAGAGDVVKPALTAGAVCVKVVERRAREGQAVDLDAAPRIVGVGRGFGKREDLELADALAAALEAEVGCTKSLADFEWLPEERIIGLSGAKTKPDFYIALGISGQIQHTVGISQSKLIAAVNKDKEAPIFQLADYGIVGDLFQVVPALVEKLPKSLRRPGGAGAPAAEGARRLPHRRASLAVRDGAARMGRGRGRGPAPGSLVTGRAAIGCAARRATGVTLVGVRPYRLPSSRPLPDPPPICSSRLNQCSVSPAPTAISCRRPCSCAVWRTSSMRSASRPPPWSTWSCPQRSSSQRTTSSSSSSC